jgi:hypothetical protein
MQTQDIINAIYNYYPRQVDQNDVSAVKDSLEYKARVKKCHDAVENNWAWSEFKNELTEYSLSIGSSRLYDYSMLGNVPCYHGSIRLNTPEPVIISVFISIIIPLWAYKITGIREETTVRYKYGSKREDMFINELTSIVNRHFPSYSFVHENQHKIVISDIVTAFKASPTIFEAIFTESEN